MSTRSHNRVTASLHRELADSVAAGGLVPSKRLPAAKRQRVKKTKVSAKSNAMKKSRLGQNAKPKTRSTSIQKAAARKILEEQSRPIETVLPGEQEMPLVKKLEAIEINPAAHIPMVETIVNSGDEPTEALAPIDLLPSSASENAIAVQVSSQQPEQNLFPTVNPRWVALRSALATGWSWVQQRVKSQQSRKRLRVCETVSLGEKRFIAVIQVDGEQFLVGGSSSSIATLAHLERSREFSDVFRQRYQQDPSQA